MSWLDELMMMMKISDVFLVFNKRLYLHHFTPAVFLFVCFFTQVVKSGIFRIKSYCLL